MNQSNLFSLVLTLQPVQTVSADSEKPLPSWWGRAVHALLLDTIRQTNDVLAAELHDSNRRRPFTVSTLMGPSTRNGLDAETSYRIRMTAFRQDVVEHLLAAIEPGGKLATDNIVELDYIGFQIQSVEPFASGMSASEPIPKGHAVENQQSPIVNRPSPWASLTSYQEMSAPYLLAQKKAPRRVSLKFTSPTSFKSKGMHVPVPMPRLVFGSLLNCWNDFAPIAFPPEVLRYADECLAISRYKLQSRSLPIKSRGLRVGGVGEITYVSLNYDRYWMSVIQTLAMFSLFGGVGGGTAMGLGQARIVD